MNECPRSRRIEEAALRGVLEGPDRTHVAHCAECGGLVAAIRALGSEGRAAEQVAASRLPSAAEILATAAAARARPGTRRALWPIIWPEWAAAALEDARPHRR